VKGGSVSNLLVGYGDIREGVGYRLGGSQESLPYRYFQFLQCQLSVKGSAGRECMKSRHEECEFHCRNHGRRIAQNGHPSRKCAMRKSQALSKMRSVFCQFPALSFLHLLPSDLREPFWLVMVLLCGSLLKAKEDVPTSPCCSGFGE
jgi:hypothetical protein